MSTKLAKPVDMSSTDGTSNQHRVVLGHSREVGSSVAPIRSSLAGGTRPAYYYECLKSVEASRQAERVRTLTFRSSDMEGEQRELLLKRGPIYVCDPIA